jgi:hydroxymethylpyrimidine/phosphomethylpyrimidine kinase
MTSVRESSDSQASSGPRLPSGSRPIVLTIAGFDPSSGAGITADLKTFAAHDLYGVSCITGLTIQSTQGVRRVVPLDPGLVSETLAYLAEDMAIAGIKIGMLASAPILHAVADFLAQRTVPRRHIVLDPVIRSSSGVPLLEEAGVHAIRERLLGQVGWITPNVAELAVLAGADTVSRESILAAARELRRASERAGNRELYIVATGGDLDQPDDFLLEPDGEGAWIEGTLVETTSTHGTGCAFSSALLSLLVQGCTGAAAVSGAKRYVAEALAAAYPVGQGRGPMDHFYGMRGN